MLFTHAGWREPVEFMHHRSTKWASFPLSLKALVESGRRTPAPHDLRIGDWRRGPARHVPGGCLVRRADN